MHIWRWPDVCNYRTHIENTTYNHFNMLIFRRNYFSLGRLNLGLSWLIITLNQSPSTTVALYDAVATSFTDPCLLEGQLLCHAHAHNCGYGVDIISLFLLCKFKLLFTFVYLLNFIRLYKFIRVVKFQMTP